MWFERLKFRIWLWIKDIQWRKIVMKATLDYNNNPTPANESWYNIATTHWKWIQKTRKRLT